MFDAPVSLSTIAGLAQYQGIGTTTEWTHATQPVPGHRAMAAGTIQQGELAPCKTTGVAALHALHCNWPGVKVSSLTHSHVIRQRHDAPGNVHVGVLLASGTCKVQAHTRHCSGAAAADNAGQGMRTIWFVYLGLVQQTCASLHSRQQRMLSSCQLLLVFSAPNIKLVCYAV